MTKLFAGTPHAKFIAAASAVILTIAIATSARGVQLQAARVTQVVNDVKLRGKEAPRPVALGDLIRHGAPVSTGTQSRSELTFADGTTTRLGANTSLSFKEGTREMNLVDGAILFQVPKGSGGATIKTAGVTAAITGTTGIGEFHPATASHPHLFSKWLCLEGTFRLYLPNGQSVEVGPGKMVTTDGESFSPVLTFDIARLVSTSLFFTGFDRPLPSLDLIVLEEQKQLFAPPTPNPLDPTRIVDVISQAIVAEEAQTSPSESPTPPITPTPPVTPTPPPPTPSESGTPSVITAPVPYLITNGTVITTDPSITTNGVTDFGKIYRGPVDDGTFSLWAFGSTSAVDTALDFDTNFENAGHFPLAAFKFRSLMFIGNPTIDLTNGVTNLALISVGDITSGLPGGTLTFSGLDALLLASQDGSINFGAEIAFQGIPTLVFYARGTNGDLTLASPIIGTTDLFLYAGRNITFNAGTDLILGGQFSTRSAGGNISVSESGNIAIGGSLAATSDVIADAANGGNITFATEGSFSASDVVVETTVEPSVTLTDGANISFDIGTSLTVNGGSLSLTINDSNGGTIGTGGNITLNTGANLTVNGGGALSLSVLNNNGGNIGTGGNISVTTGGDLTAGSIDALINNSGGTIGGSANLAFNLSGQLATQSDTSFTIDNSSVGTIGGIATVNVTANNISNGGALSAGIMNFGGTIVGGANINFNLTGDLTTQGDALFTISNDTGGMIGSDAMINVTAANIISTGGALNAAIVNSSGGGGGNIVGTANINFNLTSDLQTVGDASFTITNSNGGMIGADAAMNVSAANISTGGILNALIDNSGGTIGGNANLAFNLSGQLATQSDTSFTINNSNAGMIGVDAGMNVSAASISTVGSVFANILNFASGNIVGGADLSLNLTGDLTTQGDATLAISNDTGGTIGSDAVINVTAANISTGGALNAAVVNSSGGSGGSIVGSANITFNLTGDLTTQGNAFLRILNDPGTIGSHAMINVTANNVSTGTLDAAIDNSSGGMIGGMAILFFDLSGGLASTSSDASFRIDNANRNGISGGSINGDAIINVGVGGDISAQGTGLFAISNDDAGSGNGGGTIGSNAMINVNAANISTGGPLSATIDNFGGGTIGGMANLAFNLSGQLATQSDTSFTINNFNAGMIGADAATNVSATSISTVGSLDADINNHSSGNIVGSANIVFNLAGDLTTTGDATLTINDSTGGMIGADAGINVSAASISAGGALFANIFNSDGGTIVGSAAVNFTLTGDLTTTGDANFMIDNHNGGMIGVDAAMNVSAANISTVGSLNAEIFNSGADHIGGSANVVFNLSGQLATQSDTSFTIDNSGGTIGVDAAMNVSATSILTAGSLFANIINTSSAGNIVGSANINFNLTGDLQTLGDASFTITNSNGGMIGADAAMNVSAANISTGGLLSATIDNFGGGTIGGNATINVTAASITANSLLAQIDNSNGGSIGFLSGSSANVTLNVAGDLTTTQGDATFQILNSDNGSGPGTIGSDAVINVAANNISTGGALVADIFNLTGGTIGGNATVNVTAKNISAGGGRFSASILNGGGNIGLDAAVNVSAASISASNVLVTNILNSGGTISGNATIIDLTAANINTFALQVAIDNAFGGSIGSGANITLNVGGDITNQSGSGAEGFINNEGGTIGGNATFNMTAANITAPSLLAHIDNSNGGSIGGNAAINMNVSGSATVTNATVEIVGNDPAGSAEININGSYDVGGTFLSQIGANDGIGGNGTLTFNNASAHADVLKAGVFGANGVLNVGGGALSADTTLKLYAPGSNGQLNFVSNVTLGGNGAKILAANAVTIVNNVVVTIGGPNPVDVFVNFVGGVPNANYTGFGGNNSTTGTFAGAGANNPQPLINAPPFGPASPAPIPTRTRIHPGPPSTVRTGAINVSSSDELLALLDDFTPGRDGRIRIPASKSTSNSRNSNRVDAARLNAPSRLNADRREMDRRTASTPAMRRLPQ